MPQTASALHGEVPGTYVRLLFEYLAARGQEPVALLGEPAPAEDVRAVSRMAVTRWKQLLERAAEALGDPLLGLHLGQTVTAAHLGVMGYVLLACGNLGAALQRFDAYQRLLYDVNPHSSRLEAKALVLEWGVAQGRPGALVDETAITALVQFARDLCGQRIPLLGLCFANPPPADTRPYEDYYGCPVRFGGGSTELRLAVDYLALPLRRADAHLLAVLEQQAEQLLQALPQTDDTVQAVRRAIARLLREGEPSLEAVATALHCAPRTLHRRLAASDLAFRPLLEDTRRCLAEAHLRDPRLTLAEVAGLLGYSEQSAFNRAFSRWTGQSPGRFRRQLPRPAG